MRRCNGYLDWYSQSIFHLYVNMNLGLVTRRDLTGTGYRHGVTQRFSPPVKERADSIK